MTGFRIFTGIRAYFTKSRNPIVRKDPFNVFSVNVIKLKPWSQDFLQAGPKIVCVSYVWLWRFVLSLRVGWPFVHTIRAMVSVVHAVLWTRSTSALCQINVSLSVSWLIFYLKPTAPLFIIVFDRKSSRRVLGEENGGWERWKAKGEIPEITISEVRRARLTDGPVQTTRFSPQRLCLNLCTTVRCTWWRGKECVWCKDGEERRTEVGRLGLWSGPGADGWTCGGTVT